MRAMTAAYAQAGTHETAPALPVLPVQNTTRNVKVRLWLPERDVHCIGSHPISEDWDELAAQGVRGRGGFAARKDERSLYNDQTAQHQGTFLRPFSACVLFFFALVLSHLTSNATFLDTAR